MFCSDGFDTMHVVSTNLLCVVCIGLLAAEFSTVNTEQTFEIFCNLYIFYGYSSFRELMDFPVF